MHNLYTQGPGERVISVYYDPARRKNAARKRVAAYCRVSTDSDAQLGSLENQMAAFRHQVSLHDDWELVQIYADEGISGTSTRHRAGFQKMIADCKSGKIDYIITKSISRFARNTMDCLKYVRELQGMGVQVYFEKEGIDTAGSISEILLTVMAAFAQENSHELYGRLFCASCGEPYMRCTFTRQNPAPGEDKHYKVWRCRGRLKGSGCKNPVIREDALKGILEGAGKFFVTAEGKVVAD